MPSVLVETGFLTNPTEEEYLNSEKGQAEVADAITTAFKKYKDEIEK
jgi:N-acetylmuramoyl-L-alanine amidase